jgi:hypothetical protein
VVANAQAGASAPRYRQVGIQFHACGPEAIAMVAGWTSEFNLAAAVGRMFPDEQVAVRDGDFTAALATMPHPDFVLLSRRPLHLNEDLCLSDLIEANVGTLIVSARSGAVCR